MASFASIQQAAPGTDGPPSSDAELGFACVTIDGVSWRAASWAGAGSAAATVAGHRGVISTDRCRLAGVACVLEREKFVSDCGRFAGLRFRVMNRGSEPIYLGELLAEAWRADASAVDADASLRVVRMARHKNDIPGVYWPGVVDTGHRHAAVDSAEYVGDDASAGDEGGGQDLSIYADPLVVLTGWDVNGVAQAVGVLGQTSHLTRLRVQADEGSDEAVAVDVVCELDQVRLEGGGDRATHWVFSYGSANAHEAIDTFAQLFEQQTGLAPRASLPAAPSVICSWYFYGRDFLEADLHHDLESYRTSPFPSDVFLIDNGWMDGFGSWQSGERFPSGMADAARRIGEAGLEPGIWTAPFLIQSDAEILSACPDLVARDRSGNPCVFPYSDPGMDYDYLVVDPTAPSAERYFTELYARLRAWGYRYHKIDFIRAPVSNPNIRFANPSMTRAEAYRRGLELVRRAVGEDGYLMACGGIYEAGLGLVDAQRVGSDVKGRWYEPDRSQAGYLVRIKQSVFRAWSRRWWHTDPDALQLRRRSEPFRGRDEFGHLSEGRLTDDEALTTVVLQYVTGGLICLSERIDAFDADRRAMLRHVIPSVNASARPIDLDQPVCPTMFLTRVTPGAPGLWPWWTLVVTNWEDRPASRDISVGDIAELTGVGGVLAFEMIEQRYLGQVSSNDTIRVDVPAHGARVLRLAPIDGQNVVLLGTDLHLSGGGVELSRFEVESDRVRGRLETPWRLPVMLTLARFEDGRFEPVVHSIEAGVTDFTIPL
ncbi:MAG: hypothetical protein AAF823_11360 [Planctomycetota bacterium]